MHIIIIGNYAVDCNFILGMNLYLYKMKQNRTDEQLREPLSPHDQNYDQEKGGDEEDKQVLLTKRKYPTRLNKYGYGSQVTCTQKYITCIASKYALTYEQVSP
jgi:hypothetical protein